MNELLKQIKLTEVEGFTPGTPCAKVSLSDRCPKRAYCVKKKIRPISDREYYARLFYRKYIKPEGAISLNEILKRPFFSVYENIYSGDEYCLYWKENGMWYEAETVDTEFVDDPKLAESVRLEILKMMEEYRDEIEKFKDREGCQYYETGSNRYDYVPSNYGKIGEYCADNVRLTRAFGFGSGVGNLKLAAAVLTLSILSATPALAASFDAVPKTGVDERVLEDETIKRVPQEVIDYWVRLGGRLEFTDSLVVNGVLADGVYWKGGSDDNLIKVSRRMLSQGFVGSTAYSLVHEIGHFVWFNGSPSEEDIRICEEYYNYYGPYSPSVTSMEEAFATMYVRYKNGAYGMSEEEMQCVERVEQSCIERSMGEVGPGVESKFHYRGVWGQDGDKWYYEENGVRLKDCDAVVFWHDRENWTGGTRNMYHFNSDGYTEVTS